MSEQSDPNDPPPVLEYRAPQTVQSVHRKESIRMGCFSVWALLVFAVVSAPIARGHGLLVLGLVALLLIFLSITRYKSDRHAGFLLGVCFGVLILAGLLFLLFIICGNSTWR